jgi:hypothetical protein
VTPEAKSFAATAVRAIILALDGTLPAPQAREFGEALLAEVRGNGRRRDDILRAALRTLIGARAYSPRYGWPPFTSAIGVATRTHLAFMQATRMETRCKPAFGCECGRAVHECACQACARTVARKEDALRTYAATGRIPDMKEAET